MAYQPFGSLLGGSDDDEKGGLGGMMDMASSLAGGAGGDALGGLGSLLGAAPGQGGDLVGLLGNVAGMGADQLMNLPIVGDIVEQVAGKLGIPASQAATLVSGAITMLTSKMKRSGASDLSGMDFDDWDAEFADESEVVAQVAEETGLAEEQVAAGMQDAMQMLADAADASE